MLLIALAGAPVRAADVGTHASRRHALAISLRPLTERRGVFAQAGVRRPRARARVGDTARACPPATAVRGAGYPTMSVGSELKRGGAQSGRRRPGQRSQNAVDGRAAFVW